jgi:methylthioribulose-1-phosphate dehydratase
MSETLEPFVSAGLSASQAHEYGQKFARLLEVIRFLHQRGWAPATTSNYSLRMPPEAGPERFALISRTGVDKSYICAADFIFVSEDGQVLPDCPYKPSAETLLHTMVYRNTAAGCVLHTHSVANTVLTYDNRTIEPPSGAHSYLHFQGYEMAKALAGFTTHHQTARLLVVPNSQDMPVLARHIESLLNRKEDDHTGTLPGVPGFILAGHGLYAWGASPDEAKRHVEALEFLLACRLAEHQIPGFGQADRLS